MTSGDARPVDGGRRVTSGDARSDDGGRRVTSGDARPHDDRAPGAGERTSDGGEPASSDPRVAEVAEQVAGLPDLDDRTAASKCRVLAELRRLPRPFDEHADLTHLTASAIVVGPRGTLLHRHRRLGRWLQPGGHLDPGEHPADAAVREVGEETGLAARHTTSPPALVHVDVHEGGRGHTHLDLRYLLTADGDPAPAPGESQAVAWLGWEEAIAIADAGLVAALRALRPR